MNAIHKLLNIALPLLTLILLTTFMLPYLFFKLLLYVKKYVSSEKLTGKVVLITGAASGIGEQLAYEYARQGAVLSLVDIKRESLAVVAHKARSLGSSDVIIIGADVSKVEDCKRFVDETVNHFGSSSHGIGVAVDHLVNNAGTGTVGRVSDCDDVSQLTPTMEVNFWGAVYGTLNAIPHLKNSKGRIIVIASTCGWYPLPKLSIYNASKAGVISFFETLRTELGWAIGITIVTPGFVKTDLGMKVVDEEAALGIFPMGSAVECAKAIVKSACRGDMYVTYPSWMKVLFPWKVLCPQVVDWANRLVLISSNTSRKPEVKAE